MCASRQVNLPAVSIKFAFLVYLVSCVQLPPSPDHLFQDSTHPPTVVSIGCQCSQLPLFFEELPLAHSPLAKEWLTWVTKGWPLCLKVGPLVWCHFYSRAFHGIRLKLSSSWEHILSFFSSFYVLLPSFSFSREHSQ